MRTTTKEKEIKLNKERKKRNVKKKGGKTQTRKGFVGVFYGLEVIFFV